MIRYSQSDRSVCVSAAVLVIVTMSMPVLILMVVM